MKFYSSPLEGHEEVPLADGGHLEKVVSHWQARQQSHIAQGTSNHCFVLSVMAEGELHPQAKLNEMLGLVEAQQDVVVGAESRAIQVPNPKTFLGKGLAHEIAGRITELGANLLVLDANLTPSQLRNLEALLGCAVSDREAVILNVFMLHASSRHARMQVTLSHLQYLRPRIRGLGMNMDQQAGGIMQGKGPGETASELMARQIDGKIAQAKQAIKQFKKAIQRQQQSRSHCQHIALVGYTNAGKTTLMNALTATALSTRNRPFETLDTTTRCLQQHAVGNTLLSDTVGFIRNLPTRLLDSFESTLAVIREVDLIVVVVDSSDPEWRQHIEVVEEQLAALKASAISRLTVFNKIDCAVSSPIEWMTFIRGPALCVSQYDVDSLKQLKQQMLQMVSQQQIEKTLYIPYEATQAIEMVYRHCQVLKAKSAPLGMQFLVKTQTHVLEQIKQLREVFQQ